jgi:hypothetical protein
MKVRTTLLCRSTCPSRAPEALHRATERERLGPHRTHNDAGVCDRFEEKSPLQVGRVRSNGP